MVYLSLRFPLCSPVVKAPLRALHQTATIYNDSCNP